MSSTFLVLKIEGSSLDQFGLVLQIELAFKSRILVEALTSDATSKLCHQHFEPSKKATQKSGNHKLIVISSDDLSKKEGLCN